MSNHDRDDRRNAGTFIALFGILFVAAGFVAITFMVVPTLAFAVLIGFVFIFVIAFHYMVWGHWLSRRPPPDEDED
jgi:uncharacterized membrane protein HdeD (DUF308 family)